MSVVDNTTTVEESSNVGITPTIRFWSYLFSNIASVLCTFFVLYHFLWDSTLRRAIHNHVIIILLIIDLIYELTNIPWILHASYTGMPLIASPVFYLIWLFIDYAFYSTQIALFAWAAMERHILIFHDRWISTRKKRFFVHYLPIAVIIIYCFIFYSLVYFAPFCENSFDEFVAGGVYIPCVFSKTLLGTWDLLFHQVVPTFLILIFSFALVFRVLWQKRKFHQQMKWKKIRKMTIQLISIVILYLLFNGPWTFVLFAFQYGLAEEQALIAMSYTIYFYYYVIFLFPFVCCGFLPELRKKVPQCIFRTRTPQVSPTGLVTAQMDMGATQ